MNGTLITCSCNHSVFPNKNVVNFHNSRLSLPTTIKYPYRPTIRVIHRIHRKVPSPNRHYQPRKISITARQSVLPKGMLQKISTDILIDGCCIAGNFALSCVSVLSCVSIFATCILNNIFLNLSIDGSDKFWKQSLYLFKLGLITNTIGSLIYVQPFNVLLYTKYVVFLSLGMSILSNLRYSTLRRIEEKQLSLVQCVILRVINNIIGTVQQMTIVQYLVV